MKKTVYLAAAFKVGLSFAFLLVTIGLRPQSREGYVTVEDSLRLFYRTVGDGAETIIIALTSGWGLDSFERLAQNRRIIFFDPRSRGRSDTVKNVSQIGFEYDLQDLEAVRQYFKLEKISLIGWSYYGGVVARYAMKFPDRVNKIIQVGPIAPERNMQVQQDTSNLVTLVDSVAIRRRDEMVKTGADKTDQETYCRVYYKVLLPRYFGNPTTLANLHIPCEFPNERPQNLFKTAIYARNSMGNWDWRTELATLKVSTLVIHGEKERIVPLKGSQTWAARSNARLLIIPGAGHLPFAESANTFFSAVEDFLKGKWPKESKVVERIEKN